MKYKPVWPNNRVPEVKIKKPRVKKSKPRAHAGFSEHGLRVKLERSAFDTHVLQVLATPMTFTEILTALREIPDLGVAVVVLTEALRRLETRGEVAFGDVSRLRSAWRRTS